MKKLFLGIALIIVLGIGGFLYRAAIERRETITACPLDAKICPDGTALGRVAPACSFPACPPPNVLLANLNLAFALPEGYEEVKAGTSGAITYRRGGVASTTESSEIVINRYPLVGTTTPIEVIRTTAIQDASGLPAPATAFTSTTIGTRRFTTVPIGRFEGVVSTAYYFTRGTDVLRFDAIDRGVVGWTNPNLTVATLPAQADLRQLLLTLQGN